MNCSQRGQVVLSAIAAGATAVILLMQSSAAVAAEGNDIVQRLAQLEARMTKVEQGRFRFPVSLVVNKTPEADFAAHREEGARWDDMRSRVIDHGEKLSDLENRLKRQDHERDGCHKRLDEDSATFDKMRTAFKAMTERLAAVEARVAATTNPGGP
jgi:uncharacterized coiled-coil protein SlyX